MTKAYQERLITLVRDTVTLLCKNGLEYSQEFCVEGLLGVTLDKGEVFLIPVKELVNDKGVGTTDTADDGLETFDDSGQLSPKRERKKKRKHQVHSSMPQEDDSNHYETGTTEWEPTKNRNDDDRLSNTTDDQPAHKRSRDGMPIKSEIQDDDESSHDVVVIKEEISDDEFASAFQGSQMDNSALGQTAHNDPALAFFSQPGTSQMNFSMDQLSQSALSGAMSGSLPAGVQGNESWLDQSGDNSALGEMGSPTTPGGQKHQVNVSPMQSGRSGRRTRQTPRKLQTAENPGRYPCDVCGERFSTNMCLKRHQLNVHHGVRHFCMHCDKSYCQKSHLNKHVKVKHGDLALSLMLPQIKLVQQEYLLQGDETTNETTEELKFNESCQTTEELQFDENGQTTEELQFDENGQTMEELQFDENDQTTDELKFGETGQTTQEL